MNIALPLNTVQIAKAKIYLASWPETFLILSIFSKELASIRIFGIDFDFFAYSFALIFLIWKMNRIFSFPLIPWKIYGYLLGSSLLSIAIAKMQFDGFIKQFIPILIIYSVNFYLVGKHDWRRMFQLYVKIAFFTAIFGIVQVLLSFGGIDILIKESQRLDSVAYEPSHYASIIVPAIVFTFFHYSQYKLYFLVMIVALFLTFNLTGYLAFLVVVSIAYVNPIYIVISLPILYYVVFYVLAGFNKNFSDRINETLAVFSGNMNVITNTINTNGTTVSLYSNLMVADNNLKNYNIFGSGLGGHEETYYRFYSNSIFRLNYYYGLNAPSGHALTIRVFSEFGIVGLLVYVYMLLKRIILMDRGIFRSISLACLSHFICKTFKLGGYIDYGTPFFLAMLFVNYFHYKRGLRDQ